MRFINPEPNATVADIARIEASLSLRLPRDLVRLYLSSNGGSPDPYVYESDEVDTVVSAFLPITSVGARTAPYVYTSLVLTKKIVARQYFPFAVDGGGDYFFVDCDSDDGGVHFYRADPPPGESPLLPLGIGVAGFWSSLKPE